MSEHQLRFLCISAVIDKTGLSKSTIYSTPDFPKPIKVDTTARGGSRWVESEVLAWMVSRIQLRDAQRVPVPPPAKTKQQAVLSVSQ